jgi:hypothetical protein
MGLDIQCNKQIKATYEVYAGVYFTEDSNPEAVYRGAWLQLENEIVKRIEADGLKPLYCTRIHNMYEGRTGGHVVLCIKMEAVSHG